MKKRIFSVLSIFVLSCILVGCFGQKEATKIKNSEKDKPPNELEELQSQIDEAIKNTMKKDWTKSLTRTKDIQTTWNELYPDLQEKGIAQESVDEFVRDLNTLSDSLINMTLKLPKEEDKQGNSQEQNSQGEGSQEQTMQQGGGNQGQGEGQGQSQGQSQQANTEPSNQGGGAQGEHGGGASQQDQINKDPQKALEKVDPTVELNNEELSIVRNSIELQKHMNKFVSLFNVKAPGDLYQLKYLLYDINISSKEVKWEKADSSMKSALNLWSSIEPKALEVNKNLNLQLKQSINEIEDVVKDKNEKLIGMKAKTSLELIEKLMKAFEEK